MRFTKDLLKRSAYSIGTLGLLTGSVAFAPLRAHAVDSSPLAWAGGLAVKSFPTVPFGTSIPLGLSGCTGDNQEVSLGVVTEGYTFIGVYKGAAIATLAFTPPPGTGPLNSSEAVIDCFDYTNPIADRLAGLPQAQWRQPTKQTLIGTFTVKVTDYVALTPGRLMDTRIGGNTVDGQFVGINARAAGSITAFTVAGRHGVPANAKAVALNVTVTAPDAGGFATVFPCGGAAPDASNLNFAAGQTIPNAVVSKIAADGTICVFTSARTQVLVDVDGYFPFDSRYVPRTPARFMDTRPQGNTADGVSQRIGARKSGQVTELVVAGRLGIPTNAAAVALNVTAVDANAGGFATVFPCGVSTPDASNLNYSAGQTIPNFVMATIGIEGKVCIFTDGVADILVDVNGYLPEVSDFRSLVPGRIMDSRTGGNTVDGQSKGFGALSAGQTYELQVAGRHTVPATAKTAILNVTVTGATGSGFATVYPCDATLPDASNLNYDVGSTIPNAVFTKLSASGKACIFVSGGTDVLVDVNTYVS